MMDAKQLLEQGNLEEALASLQESIRKSPADPKLRVFLFELYSVIGKWEKALGQLQCLGSLDPESVIFANSLRPILQCETFRAEVFAGKRTPLAFGEPYPWLSALIQANCMAAAGQGKAASELHRQAFEEAPPSAGTLDGERFDWIADSDSRLGPVVEVILDGKYYWVPFIRISLMRTEPPTQLRDLVWTTAHFRWANGGEAVGAIPTRYPGTESSRDNALRLARRTEWIEADGELCFGLGQRMFTTGTADRPLLEVREIVFENSTGETIIEPVTTGQ